MSGRIDLPLTDATVAGLAAGDEVALHGVLYVARDAAHRRFMEALAAGRDLPFDPAGQLVYYMGPTPAPSGRVIGSCGPTTASRMDAMTVPLLERGLKGTMGKGRRSDAVRDACVRFGAVYLVAFGGCGAYLSGFVTAAETVAYADLGPEALLRLTVRGFPAIVGLDSRGGDLYARRGASDGRFGQAGKAGV